jgi:hypothetical protein
VLKLLDEELPALLVVLVGDELVLVVLDETELVVVKLVAEEVVVEIEGVEAVLVVMAEEEVVVEDETVLVVEVVDEHAEVVLEVTEVAVALDAITETVFELWFDTYTLLLAESKTTLKGLAPTGTVVTTLLEPSITETVSELAFAT